EVLELGQGRSAPLRRVVRSGRRTGSETRGHQRHHREVILDRIRAAELERPISDWIDLSPLYPARMNGLQPKGIDPELLQIGKVEARSACSRTRVRHFRKGSPLVRRCSSSGDRQWIGFVKLEVFCFLRRDDNGVIAFQDS